MRTADTTALSTSMRWRLDPTRSAAEFSVPHFWGLTRVKGRFDHLDGWLETDRNGHVRLELIVDAASLNTGNRKRDQHLRSADFFDTQHHPELRFQSVIAGDAGNGRLHVEGELVGDDNESGQRGGVRRRSRGPRDNARPRAGPHPRLSLARCVLRWERVSTPSGSWLRTPPATRVEAPRGSRSWRSQAGTADADAACEDECTRLTGGR
jgi:YceI-like domain